jgi:Pentapeptide repeats (8 copies)
MDGKSAMMPAVASASDTASQTSVIVAIIVAAIGALATFIVGLLNFRIQRQGQEWQRSQGTRQLELTRSAQMTDRFTRAIEQLGSGSKAVRIGGIFALERIARDSMEDDSATYTIKSIAYTLATFVRESQPAAEIRESSYIPMLKIRAPDVQAAMTVLCRSPLCDDRVNASDAELRNLNRTDLRLDLSQTDLRRASLSGARLDGVNLWGTRLEGANLRRANLRCAGLSDAHVGRLSPKDRNYKYGADMSNANLAGAYLNNVEGLREAKKTGIKGLGAK